MRVRAGRLLQRLHNGERLVEAHLGLGGEPGRRLAPLGHSLEHLERVAQPAHLRTVRVRARDRVSASSPAPGQGEGEG